ncbi:MAG: FAD-dependent oxidoreductase [Spirochaetes bacterium]|nr:FAD-dependent oxidoreductase [Spirochaetota bacterium]
MKTKEIDVAVIAGGASGLAAAISAAEGGGKTAIFEKGATTGGAANMGMGPLGVESRLQRIKQHSLTKDEAFDIFMNYTHWRVDARLVRAYIDKSADTIDWLEKMGVVFAEPASYFPGAQYTWHIVKPEGGEPGPMAAGTMIKKMTERAKQLGVEINLQTPVKKLIKQNNKITGLLAEDRSGDEIQIRAKAVIIATGGFGDNPEMVKKYTGYELGKDMHSFRIPGCNGDGVRMAWEAGAMSTEMHMELIHMIEGGGMTLAPDFSESLRQPHLIVNVLGERFMNEGLTGNSTYTGNAISIQKDKCAFAIFDEANKKYMEETGFDVISVVFNTTKVTDFDKKFKAAVESGCKAIFAAESIEELAKKTGITPKGLQDTIDEYNKFCANGKDEHFNKDRRYLRPVKTPKFYAAKFYPGAYGSLGGIKINYKAEVLNKSWEVMPGLYASGVDVCTIYGDSYVFVLPGNTMGFSINSGRIAGENASKYIKL